MGSVDNFVEVVIHVEFGLMGAKLVKICTPGK
jgi:hypothetical protein